MLSREGKQTDRGAVGAEFIGYNRRRREALLLQEFPHQPNCRPSVPAGLNQEIQDFALTVHGTPEIELPPSNYDDHLVQVPAFGRSWPPTLNSPRIGPTEFQDPSSNCLIRDVETTLGKQVLNVPIAQRETAIEPDGMLDDDRWKAVTTVGYLAHPETLKHRPCRSHAVNVTMPDWPYLWLDATYVKVREAGRIVSVAVTVAVAVNDQGRREVLGMAIGASEAEAFWTEFLRSLARRGLRGVKLLISDDHKGLRAAATRILGATWQRCRVHFARNLLAHAGRQGRRVVSAFVATCPFHLFHRASQRRLGSAARTSF